MAKIFDKLYAFFKGSNQKVVPYTIDAFSNELSNSVVQQSHNTHMSQPEGYETYYLGIPGSIAIYTNNFMDGDRHPDQDDFSPFEKLSKFIWQASSNGKGFVPIEDYYGSEKAVFAALKYKYPSHAVTILKVSLPIDELDMIETKLNGKKTYLTRPDLLSYLVSMKGMHTKTDNIDHLKTADVYVKKESNHSVKFEKINVDDDKLSQSPKPRT